MNSKTRNIVQNLLTILPNRTIDNLKKLLDSGEITISSNTYELKSKLNLLPNEINLVKKVLNEIKNSQSIIIALDLISEIQQKENQFKKIQH